MNSLTKGALAENARIVSHPEVVSCTLGQGAALLDMPSGLYYSLNPVGAHVWSRIQTPVSLAELASSVCDVFEVTYEICLADLRTLLGEFASAGLIKTQNASVA
jgi:hypothetical protein